MLRLGISPVLARKALEAIGGVTERLPTASFFPGTSHRGKPAGSSDRPLPFNGSDPDPIDALA